MPKKRNKVSEYLPEWTFKFGLEVSTRDISSNKVTSVLCLFCRQYGRDTEENVEQKQKRTTNVKYFTHPWRSDNFTSHLKTQHPTKWSQYNSLQADDQRSFFLKNEAAEIVNMRSFVQPEGSMRARIIARQKCNFEIDDDIIDTIIFDLLFENMDDDNSDCNINETKKKLLKYFIHNKDEKFYVVEVKSVIKLNMVVNFVSVGISFRQASRLYQSVKDNMGMGILGSISDNEVAHHCRIICAINLQYLKEMCKNVWAFAIAIDAGSNAGTSYLDIRLQCHFKDNLQNFHVLAIRMRECHTGKYQFDLIVELMNVLAPEWRNQLIGVSTDGASDMTGCIQGTCTRLSQECNNNIFRIWCGTHQLNLVVKKGLKALMDEKFVSTLTLVTNHLRRQQNLKEEMKSECPTFVATRWISMGRVLKWLKVNRPRLLQHFTVKKPTCTPTEEWWLVVHIIQSLMERIEKTFSAMQGLKTLLCEQQQLLTKLGQDIKVQCSMTGPMTNEETITFLDPSHNDQSHIFQLENYAIRKHKLLDSIDEIGGFVQLGMDELRLSKNVDDNAAHDRIVSTYANFSLQIVVGISKICAEQDDCNSAAEKLPPVLPLDLCSVQSQKFTACLQQQKNRFLQKFTNNEFENIDNQFRELRIAFSEQKGFAMALQSAKEHSNVQSFEQCWGPLGNDFKDLKRFCGGIASVMPGTSCVESDFSLINWTKNPNSRSLTDFSLESILHCKQYRQLQNLFE